LADAGAPVVGPARCEHDGFRPSAGNWSRLGGRKQHMNEPTGSWGHCPGPRPKVTSAGLACDLREAFPIHAASCRGGPVVMASRHVKGSLAIDCDDSWWRRGPGVVGTKDEQAHPE
jgi:hypothetical protein